MKLGDIGNHKGIFCKITEIDGGIFTVETPHGTKIKLGFAWLAASWKPLEPHERELYNDWVVDAARIKARFDLENGSEGGP